MEGARNYFPGTLKRNSSWKGTHARKTPIIKAQHPDWELWQKGILIIKQQFTDLSQRI